MGLNLARVICRCVPSPQSNKIISPKPLNAIEEWFLWLVGIAEDVPKNISSIVYTLECG
jgi:hypothetical protein